jgi:hypothetical protein
MAGRPKATRQSLPNRPETLVFERKRLLRGVYPECLEGLAMTAFHPLLARHLPASARRAREGVKILELTNFSHRSRNGIEEVQDSWK